VPFFGSGSGNGRAPLGAKAFCSRLTSLAAKLGSGLVLFATGIVFLYSLASRYFHDADGIADHVSGTLLSFGAFGHRTVNVCCRR
jgi:hypothetical protein